MNKIPYGRHEILQEDIDAVVDILKNGPITQGPIVSEFGDALARYSGSLFGTGVSNGTAALQLAVMAVGIKTGDEVITTPMTFCATSNVVLQLGGNVRFVDIDSETLNIDYRLIERNITEKTKAIIPVDFRGHPANLPEIKQIADKHNLMVIEDGAHSIGSNYNFQGRQYRCGDCQHSDITTFSFHPVKHITTCEGGAVLTNNEEIFSIVNQLSKHGIDRREEMFSEQEKIGNWKYEMEMLGSNFRLTEIQAALGLSQLSRIEHYKKRRRDIVNYYNEHLSLIDEFIIPFEADNVDSNFHLYTLQVKENTFFDRYDLFTHLQDIDYLPMVHYIPVPLLKYYKQRFGYKEGDFPKAEKYYNQAISLPLFPSMTDGMVDKVVCDLKSFVELKTGSRRNG